MDESEKSVDLEVDELFVGLTRPATVFGVHFTAFVIEMIVSAAFSLPLAIRFGSSCSFPLTVFFICCLQAIRADLTV